MEKELLHTKVVRELISMLAGGIYKDGDRLPSERQLSEKFNVSRGTIRNAISDLEKIGIVEIRPGSGTYVHKFSFKGLPAAILPLDISKATLDDIVLARESIELPAMELACKKITDAEIAQIEGLTGEMERAVDDLPVFMELDMAFHYGIVRAGKNPVLATALEAIAEYHKFSQVFTGLYEGAEDVAMGFHKKMLQALKDRDPVAGKSIMKKHLDNMLAGR